MTRRGSSPGRDTGDPHLPRLAEALRSRVEGRCREGLVPDGSVVVAACSGGLDSVVLLDLLADLAPRHGWRLVVAHADHGLRPGSRLDAVFAGWLAAERGLPFRCARLVIDPGRRAAEGPEAAARAARHRFLDRVAEDAGADRIALAHHLQDQAETVVLGWLAGRPAAMAPCRGIRVRPLLAEPRSALRAWAAVRGLRWREDPTNRSPAFLRNRVRAEVLPSLRALNPRADRALAAAGSAAAEDARALDILARQAVGSLDGDGVDWGTWRSWPPPLRARALGLLAARAGGSLGTRKARELVEVIDRRGPGRSASWDLPGRVRLLVDDGGLCCPVSRDPGRGGPSPSSAS